MQELLSARELCPNVIGIRSNFMREGYHTGGLDKGPTRGRASVRRRAINLRSVNPSHNGSGEQIFGAK